MYLNATIKLLFVIKQTNSLRKETIHIPHGFVYLTVIRYVKNVISRSIKYIWIKFKRTVSYIKQSMSQ